MNTHLLTRRRLLRLATLVFGLAAATILVLVLIPALVGVGGDLGRMGKGVVGLYRPDTQPALTPGE